jgi:hypothetical protein
MSTAAPAFADPAFATTFAISSVAKWFDLSNYQIDPMPSACVQLE